MWRVVLLLILCDCAAAPTLDAGPSTEVLDAGRFVSDDTRLPLEPCGWDGRELDAGVLGFALDGTDCREVRVPDAATRGVFSSLELCQTACPCVTSKLNGLTLGVVCNGFAVSSVDGGYPPDVILRRGDHIVPTSLVTTREDLARACRLSLDERLCVFGCAID